MSCKISKKRALLLLLSLCLPLPAFADRAREIDALVQDHFAKGRIHGSVLVAEKGQVVYKGGVGMADIEWGVPNAPDTKFRLGSITKQFTAALIMQLVEQGKVALDVPITTYLTDYRKETGDKVTVHHLLTHTSGIPSYTSEPKFMEEVSRDPYTVPDFVAKHCSGDLEFEPGSTWRYDNSGYFLLGAIIEIVTGGTYEEALRKMLDACGMADSGYDRHEPILPKRAEGYERKDKALVNAGYLDMGLPYAAGSMYSTVEDLYKWDRALYTDSLLTAASKGTMFTDHKDGYGYGWSVKPMKVKGVDKEVRTVSHGGGINGFNTLITRDIENENLVVVLNNAVPSNSESLTREVFELLYAE